MKRALRISILILIVAAAFAGNSPSRTPLVATNLHSSVPGGGGPMPTCNPFTQNCPSIR